MESVVHVRPAWQAGSELGERARALMIAEWAEMGLLDGVDPDLLEGDPEKVLAGVQRRDATVTDLAARRKPGGVVTRAAGDSPGREASSATFEGTALRYHEVATIGRDSAGRAVRERFLPGSLRLPVGGLVPLVNRGHDRSKVIGHVVSVTDVGDEVRVRGVVADQTSDGHDACELAALGSVSKLSIEFLSLDGPAVTATRDADGGKLHEHRNALFVGLAFVPEGAYGSARLTRLLDRRESGKQREHDRQEAMRRLNALGA